MAIVVSSGATGTVIFNDHDMQHPGQRPLVLSAQGNTLGGLHPLMLDYCVGPVAGDILKQVDFGMRQCQLFMAALPSFGIIPNDEIEEIR